MEKIKVGVVNYLNAKPLLYGLKRSPACEQIILVEDYPARLGEMLMNGTIDLGLVPIAVIPMLKEYHIVGEHCIATEGEIASVALFSEVPLQEIKKVFLDYQSRTSVELLKYLMKESWNIHPEMIPASGEDFINEIKGTTAGLVIGDRAFEQRKRSSYIYDLGSEWRSITGLPFVFAAWISTRPLPPAFINMFDKANETGLARIDEIVQEQDYTLYDLKKYYTLHVSYKLDDRKRKGMEYFLTLLQEL